MSIPKNILLIGGTSGIGLTTLELLNECDSDLVVVGRDFTQLQGLKNLKSSTHLIKHDFSDLNRIDDFILKIDHMKFDGVVFSMGVNEMKPLKFITYQHLLSVFNINVFSFQLIISSLVKRRMIVNGASIVGLGSISSELNELGSLAYSSSKAAFNSSVKVMAKELSKSKIRVNGVLPGALQSRMNENLGFTYEKSPEIFDSLIGPGILRDISQIIIFLLSTNSSWQTGSLTIVDGGQSI